MSWTGKSLQAYIEANGATYVDRAGNRHPADWEGFKYDAAEGDWELKNGEKTEAVKSFRDNEHMVNIFKIGEQHFRILGDYDSWNGTTWDWAEIEEVTPVEETIVKYVRVKS